MGSLETATLPQVQATLLAAPLPAVARRAGVAAAVLASTHQRGRARTSLLVTLENRQATPTAGVGQHQVTQDAHPSARPPLHPCTIVDKAWSSAQAQLSSATACTHSSGIVQRVKQSRIKLTRKRAHAHAQAAHLARTRRWTSLLGVVMLSQASGALNCSCRSGLWPYLPVAVQTWSTIRLQGPSRRRDRRTMTRKLFLGMRQQRAKSFRTMCRRPLHRACSTLAPLKI